MRGPADCGLCCAFHTDRFAAEFYHVDGRMSFDAGWGSTSILFLHGLHMTEYGDAMKGEIGGRGNFGQDFVIKKT